MFLFFSTTGARLRLLRLLGSCTNPPFSIQLDSAWFVLYWKLCSSTARARLHLLGSCKNSPKTYRSPTSIAEDTWISKFKTDGQKENARLARTLGDRNYESSLILSSIFAWHGRSGAGIIMSEREAFFLVLYKGFHSLFSAWSRKRGWRPPPPSSSPSRMTLCSYTRVFFIWFRR